MGGLFLIAAGAFIAAFALRDIFHDLFHPTRSGSLSDWIARAVSYLAHRRPSTLELAGPLSLMLVILTWVLLVSAGFALIYWSTFPAGFQVNTGKSPESEHHFLTVLYFSLSVLTTMGTSDITPRLEWLRMLVTFHALVGFWLLTASISWIVLLFPALSRMRALARRTSLLADAEQKSGIEIITVNASNLLGELALDVIRTRVDLIHFPLIYHFYSAHKESSLANAIPHLMRLVEQGGQPDAPEQVRLAAAVLDAALNDLAAVLCERFVRSDASDPQAVFRAYAKDHIQPA